MSYTETYTFYRLARAVAWVKEEYSVTATSEREAKEEILALLEEGMIEPLKETLDEVVEYTGEEMITDASDHAIAHNP